MTEITFEQWRERAAQARRDWPAFIDGRTTGAVSRKQFAMVDPATGKEWAQVASCDAADVDLAVKSGRAAFEDRRWAGLKTRERKRILLRLAGLMRTHREELALLESLSVGEPTAQALGIDLRAAPDAIAYYAEACDKVYDQIAPT